MDKIIMIVLAIASTIAAFIGYVSNDKNISKNFTFGALIITNALLTMAISIIF